MLKLLMKKLGTPAKDEALSVEGSGGVSAEGGAALGVFLVFVGAETEVVGAGTCTTVRGWGRWVRTSGCGCGGASVVVVGVVVVFGLGVVLVLVVGVAGSEGGASVGGAGTVVVPVAGGEASVAGAEDSEVVGSATVVVSVDTAPAGRAVASAAQADSEIAARSAIKVDVVERGSIEISCRAGS
ncbi:MAG: hypothetical protein WBQ21_09060 [Solirubrobacteraceae bacterium]